MPVTIKPAPGAGSDAAALHVSAAPGAVDYVLDEVQATSAAVAVFDSAASATLAAQTTSVGAGSAAPFFGDTAYGYQAQCSGAAGAGVAVGWKAQAGTTSVAVGADARALSDNSTTINPASSAKGATAVGAVSVGRLCAASGDSATSVGDTSTASGASSVALGASASAQGTASIAIGQGASVTAAAAANGVSAIAIGTTAIVQENCTNAVAIGSGAIVRDPAAGGVGTAAVSLGYQAETRAASSIAIGHAAVAGDAAAAKGTQAIAIGYLATAGHDYDIAIGSGATASTAQPDGIAVGRTASVDGQFGIAIGKSAACAAASSVCLGAGTSSGTFTDSIVIGSSSTGAVIGATTATAVGAVVIGSGGAGGLGYLRGNQVTAKHLSPAVTSAVTLGTGLTSTTFRFGSSYFDAVFARQAVDWAYQGYAGAHAMTSATGVAYTAAVGAGTTSRAATGSLFTNTGVLTVTVPPTTGNRTYMVVLSAFAQLDVDDNNQEGQIYVTDVGTGLPVPEVCVARLTSSSRGTYTAVGYKVVNAGAAFTFTPRLRATGGRTLTVLRTELFVHQV